MILNPGCEASEHGCCEDGYTPASGSDLQGCACAGSKFGCCPDGIKVIKHYLQFKFYFDNFG